MNKRFGVLKTPWQGYRNVEYVEDVPGYKILVEICGCGKLLEVWDDDVNWED